LRSARLRNCRHGFAFEWHRTPAVFEASPATNGRARTWEFVEACHAYRCTSRKAPGFAPNSGLSHRSGSLYLPVSGGATIPDSEFAEAGHEYRCTSCKALGFAPNSGLTWRSGNLYLPLSKGATNTDSEFVEASREYRCTSCKSLGLASNCGLTWRTAVATAICRAEKERPVSFQPTIGCTFSPAPGWLVPHVLLVWRFLVSSDLGRITAPTLVLCTGEFIFVAARSCGT
jgi:hypothetical protein